MNLHRDVYYNRRMRSVRVLLVAMSLWMSASAMAAREPRVFFPGGVRDAEGRLAYVGAEGGGIDALVLAGSPGGARRWTSKAASEPVLATRQWLVATEWAESHQSFHLVALDAASGAMRQRSPVVKLPEQTGSITAAWRDGDRVTVSWESHNEYHGGPAPTESIKALLGRSAAGAVAFDIATGKLERLAASLPPPSLPEAARGLELFPVQSGDTGLWVAGDRLGVVSLDEAGDHRHLALHTFAAAGGRAFPPVTLLEHPPAFGYLILVPPLDPFHVQLIVVNDQTVDGQPPGSITRYEFYDVLSGKKSGSVLHREGMQPPFGAVNGRAYYLENVPSPAGQTMRPGGLMQISRRLVALELASGRTAWTRPIAPASFPLPLP